MPKLLKTTKVQLAILILFTIIAYIPSFEGVWQYDDIPEILNNKNIQHGLLNPEFFKGSKVFRSIPYASFALNYKIHGYNIFGYHIFNFIIHALTGLVLYLFILELFLTIKFKTGTKYNLQKVHKIAFITTLLWILAPINVQAVSYIVQRLASMAGLFYLCSLLLYLKLRNQKQNSNKTNLKILLGLTISIICAFLSKQNTFLLIPTILYIEWSFYREASIKKVKLYSLITLILIPVFILLIYLFFSSGTDTNIWTVFQNNYSNREFSPLQRLFIEPKILIHYISLMIFPFVGRFHLLYSFDWLNAPHQIMPYVSIVLIASAFTFSVIPTYVKRYKILSFGMFFFLINHVMESSIIGLQLSAEHRNYIPSIGIFLIIATGINQFDKKLVNKKILYTLVVLYIFFSMLNTWMLNLKYQEPYCNAIYDYNTEYNGLDHDVASMAVDKLMDEQDYADAYRIMKIEYEVIISNPHRHKFFDNYAYSSTRFLKFYVFLHYINSGFNAESVLNFVENRFINDSGDFWNNMKMKKYYDNIFHYFYIKSLLHKYEVLDEVTYQKSLQYDEDVINIYFYFKVKNYDKFVTYNRKDIEKLEGIELAENENNVLAKIK